MNKYASWRRLWQSTFFTFSWYFHLSFLLELRNSLLSRIGITFKKCCTILSPSQITLSHINCFVFQTCPHSRLRLFNNEVHRHGGGLCWIIKVKMPVLQNWEIWWNLVSDFRSSVSLLALCIFIFENWHELLTAGTILVGKEERKYKVWDWSWVWSRVIYGHSGSLRVLRFRKNACYPRRTAAVSGRDRSGVSFQRHTRLQLGVHGSKSRSPGGWSQIFLW